MKLSTSVFKQIRHEPVYLRQENKHDEREEQILSLLKFSRLQETDNQRIPSAGLLSTTDSDKTEDLLVQRGKTNGGPHRIRAVFIIHAGLCRACCIMKCSRLHSQIVNHCVYLEMVYNFRRYKPYLNQE